MTVVRRRVPIGRRRGFRVTDRGTVFVGVLAGATTLAALGAEMRRVWRRGSAPLPAEPGHLLEATEQAMTETVEAVLAGYRGGSTRENATFNLLASFLTSLGISRGIAYLLRRRRRFGPFRNVRVGRRHIHHFVPGIVMAFVSGAAAIVTRDPRLEPLLAVPFGMGMGLTLDESALLLELEDVYWSEDGVVGLQIALGTAALLAALAIGLRFTRRGERLVLPPPVALAARGNGDGGPAPQP